MAQPVTVVRAGATPQRADFGPQRVAYRSGCSRLFPHGRDVYLPEHNHYIPMEAPELVVAEIARFCAHR